MTWRSSGVKSESKWKNSSGIANVTLSKDANGVGDGKSITFTFVDNEKNVKNKIANEKYTFKISELKGVFKTIKYREGAGQVFVNINENIEEGTQELTGVRPVMGTFFLKFAGFTRKNDGKEISLKEDDEIYDGKNAGKKISCFANYQIIDGRYTGALVPTGMMVMRYSKEVIVENNGEVDLMASGKGGWTKAAQSWLNLFDVNGVDGGIKWPESNDIQDVLKNIEDALKHNQTIFSATLENSYPGVLGMLDLDALDELYIKHPELKPVVVEKVSKKELTIDELYGDFADDEKEDEYEDARN
jgi:hypothetical protein